MESIRDRFSGRDRMGSDRGARDRFDRGDRAERMERPDRGDMGDRGMVDRGMVDRGMGMSRAMGRGGYESESAGAGIEEIAGAIEKSNSKQLEIFADCIDDVKEEVYASEKEILKAIDQVAANAGNAARAPRMQEAPTAQMDPASKEEILRAVANNTDLLLAIRELLNKKEEAAAITAPAPAEEKAETEEKPAEKEEKDKENPLVSTLAQYYNNMEEHVHKENVKCYRNVQAAITEQGTQVVEQSKKSLILIKIFAIASTVIGLANIAVLMLYILGFIY